MTPDAWLDAARRDAAGRGLEAMHPLLETVCGAIRLVRGADWNENPAGADPPQSTAADRSGRDRT